MRRLALLLLLLTAPVLARDSFLKGTGGGPLAVSPDLKIVATGGPAKTVRLWDRKTGRLLRKLHGSGPAVTQRSFGPDSSFPVQDRVTTLDFDCRGDRLVASGEDGVVRIWNVADGTPGPKTESSYEVGQVAFAPDGVQVAYIDNSIRYLESNVNLWDPATGRSFVVGGGNPHDGTVSGFRYSRDGRRLASWGKGTLKTWSAGTGEEEASLDAEGVTSVDWAPDGETLALGLPAGVQVWSLSRREKVQTFGTVPQGPVRVVRFSPDGTRLAGQLGKTLVVWELPGGRKLLEKPVARLLDWTGAGLTVQARDGRIVTIGI